MWKQLTIDDLRLILSEKETEQLNSYSVNESISDIINNTINMVSDLWRGALSAKGYTLDTRDHYTPDTYHYYILVHARYAVWSRFPNSTNIALDDARKEEYETALALLKDPYINVSVVDEEGADDSATTTGTGAGSIRVPVQRFNHWYMDTTSESLDLDAYL